MAYEKRVFPQPYPSAVPQPMSQQQMYAMMQSMMVQNQSKKNLKSSYSVFAKIKQGQHTGRFNITGVKILKGGIAMIANAHPRTGKDGNLTYTVKKNVNDTTERIKYKVTVYTTDRPHLKEEFFATYNPETQVLNIPDLSMCITSNGDGYLKKWDNNLKTFVEGKRVTGYFGRNYKKK